MPRIHPLADVKTVNIGEGTTIWQFAVVLPGAAIGKNCNINCHTFIENDVVIGDNVTVKSGVYIWDGISIEEDVFIGPSVVFTNDLRPRSKKRIKYKKTIIKKGASIGANTSILGGTTIGKYALVGMGALVIKDIPDYALVYGQPAEIKGWVDEKGEKLIKIEGQKWKNNQNEIYLLEDSIKMKKLK
jgi:acetyltransferase-like isoleucine patch superfamily enzyme